MGGTGTGLRNTHGVVKLLTRNGRPGTPGEWSETKVEHAVMELPQYRPGRVGATEPPLRVVAFFYNSAQGNSTIQLLTALGIPNESLGVTPPDRIETGQGMVLSIPCADEKMAGQVESICRRQGAEIHRQRR